jgi:hypothetical protein
MLMKNGDNTQRLICPFQNVMLSLCHDDDDTTGPKAMYPWRRLELALLP